MRARAKSIIEIPVSGRVLLARNAGEQIIPGLGVSGGLNVNLVIFELPKELER